METKFHKLKKVTVTLKIVSFFSSIHLKISIEFFVATEVFEFSEIVFFRH